MLAQRGLLTGIALLYVLLSTPYRISAYAPIPPDSTGTVLTEIGKDMSQVLQDLRVIGDKVYREQTLYYLAGAAGGTLALMQADENLRATALRNTSPSANTYFRYANEYGHTFTAICLTGGIYASGLIWDEPELRTTGRYLGESLLLSGIIVTGMKCAFGRSRPYLNRGAYDFQWFEISNDHISLPSGHSAVAFTVSTVLSMRINRWWASSLLYAGAASTAYARMYKDQHWLSDVALGAGIGIFSGWMVCSESTAPDERQSSGVIITPNLTGLTVFCRF